jgi:hypothetical protein
MKKMKQDEIPNTWKGLLYKIIFYKTKEFFFFLIILLVAWAITLIINPDIAMHLKIWLIKKISIGGV